MNTTTGGTVTPIGTSKRDCRSEVTITAIPESCYRFVNWSVDVGGVHLPISTSNPLNITMIHDTTIRANFASVGSFNLDLMLYINPNGGGTISGEGGWKDCGSVVTLTAVPNAGYIFTNWTSGSSGGQVISMDATYTFTIYRNMILTANFRLTDAPPVKVFALTVNSTTGGNTNLNGTTTWDSDSVATITATPENCYRFVNWTNANNNNVISTVNPLAITITSDTNLVANFELIKYNLNVSSSGNGNVTGSDANVNCGSSRTITATPNDCYKFVNWSDGNTQNPRTVTVTSNTALTANFELIEYNLDVSSSGNGNVVPSGNNKLGCGTSQTIAAIANSGYKFKNWTSKNNTISFENPLTITITRDTTLVANFEYDNDAIEDVIKTSTVSILPNPTSADFTVSFDVIKPSNMQIVLMDLTGKKVLDIYDGFTVDGLFTKIVKTADLAKGVYFVKILIDGNYTVEKVIVE
jgi:hypothetical protein